LDQLAWSLKAWFEDINRSASDESLERAAQAGDISSMIELGNRCFRRNGIQDREDGERWYQRAAELGGAEAITRIGRLSLLRNVEEGVALLERAAGLGDAYAMFLLGALFYYGTFPGSLPDAAPRVPKEVGKARGWLEKAAAAGHARAKGLLAVMYKDGEGGAQDYAKAVRLFQESAEADVTQSMHLLGVMYLNGEGVVRDIEKARNWFVRSAEAGNIGSMLDLRKLYENGTNGWQKDESEAHRWLVKAADAGDVDAMVDTAEVYLRRSGVVNFSLKAPMPPSDAERCADARMWFERAAAKGHTGAMLVLVVLSYSTSRADARRWAEKAAAAGNPQAQVFLEELYFREPGTSKCFIATAACGSADAPDVETLRRFRDDALTQYYMGRGLVRMYERVSPPIAAMIAPRPALRWTVCRLIIHPLARLLA